MAKDPEQRYATCGELVQAAREALGVEQALLRGMSRRTIAIVAGAVLIASAALAAGLTLALGGGGNARAKPNLAVKTNTLVRINSKTNKIADVIPVGRDPESLAYGGNTVWVYNNADHTVEGIDTRTNAIVVPPTAISGDAPISRGYIATVAADQEGAWVLSVQEPSGRGLLTRVRRDVPSTDQSQLPGTPVAIAVGDGSIWVTTTKGRTGALLRIDPRTRAVRTLALPGLDATPNWIAVGAGAVWLTDAARTSPTGSTATSGVPHSRLFRIDPENDAHHRQSPDQLLSRGCAHWRSVRALSGSSRSPGGAVPTPARRPQDAAGDRCVHTPRSDLEHCFPRAAAFVGLDGNTIWYAGDGAVRVDTRTSRIVARIHLLDHPDLFAFPSAIVTGGGSVWIAIAAPR